MLQQCRSGLVARQAQRGAFRACPVAVRQASRAARPSPRSLPVSASLTVKDSSTGVEFNLAQNFWVGEPFRCLGSGTRSKTILFVNVKVYSVAAYVEADRAAKELGLRQRGGFFDTDDDYGQAIIDGAFNKALVLHLVRDVTGEQFAEAINKSLAPRMQLAGDTASLDQFNAYFNSKALANNAEVVLLWSLAGDLEVLVTQPLAGPQDYAQAQPELRIRSATLCRALFELFLGGSPVVPDARADWVKGAKLLLDSENVKRESRKAGSG